MTHRENWVVAVLTLATCGIYTLYWQYVTTDELRQVSGRDDINPMLDLLITMLCCGLYAIYVHYRNAQVVHEVMTSWNQQHEDKSSFVMIMHLLSFFNGLTSLIALMALQDEYNKVAAAQNQGAPATF